MRRAIGFLVFASIAMPASAGTIIWDTIAPGNAIPASIAGSPGGPQVQGVGGTAGVGVQFTPSFTVNLTEIYFVIGDATPDSSYDRNVDLLLYTDNGSTLPGSPIAGASWSETGTNDLSTVQSQAVSGITLTGGVNYWLVALPADSNTATLWPQNDSGLGGNWSIEQLPGFGWGGDGPETTADPAFAIQGTAETPEPASGALAITGILILAAARRRRRPRID